MIQTMRWIVSVMFFLITVVFSHQWRFGNKVPWSFSVLALFILIGSMAWMIHETDRLWQALDLWFRRTNGIDEED